MTMKVSGLSRAAVALSVLSVVLSGCGSATDDQPDLGLVTGTVTFDGSPLGGASITFQPDSGRPARAVTDAQGKYSLIYIRDTPGCKIGHNTVSITSSVEGEDEMAAEGDDVDQTAVKEKAPLPAKYNTETELEADVKPGENTFDFKLVK